MVGVTERRVAEPGAGKEPGEEANRYCIRLSRVTTSGRLAVSKLGT
jgi:hypothetical protein